MRGLEKRIVLDAAIAVAGTSVDISNVNTGTNVNVTQTTFDINGDLTPDAVYRFELNGSAVWTDQAAVALAGQVDLNGLAGAEAFVVGKDLYVSKTFLETNAGGLSVSGAGTGFVQMQTNVTTAGDQDYGVRMQLQQNVVLTAPNVAFTDVITGGGRNLTIAGNAVFGDAATDTVTGVVNLQVTGTTTINTDTVSTTGTQTYTGAVTIGTPAGTATLTTTNDAVLFGSSVDLNSNLTVNSGTGGVTFTGAVNGGKALIVNSTGVTIFNGLVGGVTPLTSVTTNAGGTTQIDGGSIQTTGSQQYGDNVSLGANTTLTASLTSFSGTVTGLNHSLLINGNAIFGDAAGDAVAGVTTLEVTGTTTINTLNITSTGTQTFGGNVTVAANVVLNGSIMTFKSQVIGVSRSLTINGNAVFGDAAVDTVTGLTALAVSGSSTINTQTVTTSGTQTYTGAVTIGAPAGLATLTTSNNQVVFSSTTTLASDLTVSTGNGNIVWSGAINGPFDLVANSTGTTTFSAAVGNLSALTSLTTNAGGTTRINGGTVQTSGDQTYRDNVTLGAPTTLTSGTQVTFNGTVTGNANSLAITGNAVFGDAAADTVTGLASLLVSGTSTINTSTVTSTGAQTYGGAVTIGASAGLTTLTTTNSSVLFGSTITLASDLTVSSGIGNITFTGDINGPFDLIANSFGTTSFLGAVGTLSPLTSLTTNASGLTQIFGGSVTTSGNQLYGDDVSLGAATTLTSGTQVTFQGPVTGNANSLTIQGNAVFGNAAVDAVTGLASLLVTGAATINTSTVTSTGTQTYSGAVTIGASAGLATLTTTNSSVLFGGAITLASDLTVSSGSGNITFADDINGSFDLIANSNGTTSFFGAVGNLSPLTSLTTNAGGTTQLSGGSVQTTGSQTYGDNVTLGTATTLTTGSQVTFNGTVAGNANSLAVTGNAVFGDAATDSVTGLASLLVSGATTINTGTVTSTGTQTYSGAVTIGAPAGLATLTTTDSTVLFGGATTLASDLTVTTGTGNIVWTGAINGAFDLVANSSGTTTFSAAVGNLGPLTSLTTNAGGTTQINGGSVRTSGNQTYGDNVSLGANTTLTSLSGIVTFLGTVSGNTNSLQITGNAVFGDAATDTVTGLASLSVSGTTTINTNTVTSTGSQTYTGAVTIGAPAILATLTTTNSPVFFGSTTTLGSDLTVATGNGNITWTGAINGGFDLVANSAGTTIFNGPVGNLSPLTSLTTNAGGTTQINGGGVQTSGSQTYGDDVTLGGPTTLTTGSQVNFNGTVTGNSNALQITGNAVFGDAATDTVTGLASLLVSGTTTINTSTVTSTGSQTYVGNVTLGTDVTLTSSGGDLTFQNAVNGPFALVANSTGTTTFGGPVGNLSPLTSLSTSSGGTTQLSGGSVQTSGNQTYGDNVDLGGDTTLTADLVTFLGTVTGNANTLAITGNVVFGDALGDTVSGLDTLTVSGTTQINTGTVSSTGSQTYDGAVTLGQDVTLTASLVTFNEQVAGANHSLDVDGNAVFGNGAGDTVTGLTTLLVTGNSTINTTEISSSAGQTYEGTVSLGEDVTLTATLVNFNAQVTGGGNSLEIDGDAVFGNEATDTVTGLDTLLVIGDSTIHTSDVESSGTQTYEGSVTLGENVTLTALQVTFNGVVLGSGQSLTIDGNVVFGDDATDTVTGLTTLDVAGNATINTTDITSTGAQTYDGMVTLGEELTLTASLATFNGQILGGNHSLTIAGNAVFGDAGGDTVAGLTTLLVMGDATINTTDISSSVGQTYDGTVTLGEDVTLTAPLVTFNGQINGGGNSLTIDGDVIFGDEAADTVTGLTTLHVIGTATINTEEITSTSGQTYEGDVTLGSDVTLTATLVTFDGKVIGVNHALTIDGDAILGDDAGDTVTGLTTLDVTGAVTINTTDINTSGEQTYDGNVTLGEDTTLTAPLVTFNGQVIGGGNALEIDGDVIFGNEATDTVTDLTTLDVTGAATINTTDISTSGEQNYNGNVTLGENTTLTASLITFDGQVIGGGNSLEIDGNVVFGNEATDTVTGLTTLNVTGDATINTTDVETSSSQTYDGSVVLGEDVVLTATLVTFRGTVLGSGQSLMVDGNVVFGNEATDTATGFTTLEVTGDTTINTSDVSSSGGQTYHGMVTLGEDVTLTASLVTFNGLVQGAGNSLEIDGNVIFGDEAADTVTGLTTLDIAGDATINTTSISSSGAQTYDGEVTLGEDVSLTAPLVTFNGPVSGGGNSLEVDGDAVFGDEATDTVSGLDTLIVTGDSTINTTDIESTGAQTYEGSLTLGENATLTSSLVTFNGPMIGANHSLEIDGNAVFGDEATDTVTGLTTLRVTGNATINATDIHSSDGQTYDGIVTLGENATLTASLVTFNAQVIGGGNSLTVDGDAIVGDGATDTVTGLDTLLVTGDSTINTTDIESTGVQTFAGEVMLGENTTLTASEVQFESAVTGDSHSLTIDGDAVFGDEATDTVTGLTTLDVTGDSTINTTDISSSGGQTYDGNVTLGEDVTLNASLVTFNGQVAGANHSLEVDGSAIFGDEAGDTVTGLTTLLVTGNATINTTDISSSAGQTYEGTVSLGEDVTLTASLVTFNGQVLGGGNSLEVVGNTVFGDEATDAVTGLTTLHVTGATQINTNTVTSSGSQTYSGPVTIGSPAGTAVLSTTNSAVLFESTVTLLSHLTVSTGLGPVSFEGAVDGAKQLTVNTTGNTTFEAAVGASTALESLTTNTGGITFLNGGSIRTSGNQTYGDNVSLGANTTLTSLSGVVTFLGTVSGNTNSLQITGNAVFGDAATDTVTGLASLSVSGTTTINTNSVTSTGSQTYTGGVTIGAPAILATLTTTNSPVFFGSTTTLGSDLTVATGNGNITWTGAINGGFDLVANSAGTTIFNGPVGNLSPLTSLTTNAGGTTQINGGGVQTTGDQLYGDDVELGPGTQDLSGNVIHFFGGVDGRLTRQGDLNITSANAVFFDKPIGAIRDPGSVKVRAVDITFANGTYIEVGKSAAESVHIVATGTLVLPTGFVVRAAFNGGNYDGVANTFLPRPAPGVLDTALVELPNDRPIFSSKQNLDQTSTGTIELTIGNTGERGLRVFVDWGDTVGQENRFEGPSGWADGDGLGDNNDPGDLFAIEGDSTVALTHTYTAEEVRAQLAIDNTFDVKYAVFQHEAIVIEAARVEQGAESLGTPGGDLTVLTTTMVYGDPADPRFVPPLPGSVPDLVNGTAAIQIAPPTGAVPFEFEVERPAVAAAPNNDAPPLDPLVTFQQVTKDDSASSSPVVGREQRFVLRLLSPDPTAPPLAEVDLPPDSFQADRLQRLFKELPDGAYEIDLLLGENTERPILRFDIRQGRPVVPQESLDGGQLRLEDIEETLRKNAAPPGSAVESASGDVTSVESEESAQPDSEPSDGDENSSLEVRPAGTMSTLLDWKLRRRDAVREGSLTLASRLARRVCS